MRFFLLQILIVFTPLILYRLYVAFVIKRKIETGGSYNAVPLSVLFAIGLVLAILSMIIMGLVGERTTSGQVEPPKFEDGKVIPPKVD